MNEKRLKAPFGIVPFTYSPFTIKNDEKEMERPDLIQIKSEWKGHLKDGVDPNCDGRNEIESIRGPTKINYGDNQYFIKQTKRGFIGVYVGGVLKDLGNFKMSLKRIENLINPRGFNTKIYYFEVVVNQKKYHVKVSEHKLLNLEFIRKQTNFEATLYDISGIRSEELFKNHIADLVRGATVKDVYLTSGMIVDDQFGPLYLTDNKIYQNSRIDLNASMFFGCRSGNRMEGVSKINMVQLKEDILGLRKITNDNSIATVLLLTIVMSLLKSTFDSLHVDLNTIIYIAGISGVRKTSTIGLFYNYFSIFENRKFPTFAAFTSSKLLIEANKTKDQVFVVDDIYNACSIVDRKNLESSLDRTVRAIANGVGKGITNSSYDDIKPINPKSIAVLVGEFFVGNRSTRGRYIGLEFDDKTVDLATLQYFQDKVIVIPSYVDRLIQFIIDHYGDVCKIIKFNRDKYRREFQGVYSHNRFPQDLANFQVVIDIFIMFMEKSFHTTRRESVDLRASLIGDVIKVFDRYNRLFDNHEPYIRFLKGLEQLISDGSIPVVTPQEYIHSKEAPMAYIDGDVICFPYSSVFKLVRQEVATSGYKFNVTDRQISKELLEKNMIIPDYDRKGNVTDRVKKSKFGKRPRLLHLKIDMYREVLDPQEGE